MYTNGKGTGEVTCEGEIGRPHAPITFEGHFRALCPLCAASAEAAKVEQLAEDLRGAQDEAGGAEDRVKELESRELRFEELVKEQDALIEKAAALIEAALNADEDIEGEKAARAALALLKG